MLWGRQNSTVGKKFILELGLYSGPCLLVDGVNLGSNFLETQFFHL